MATRGPSISTRRRSRASPASAAAPAPSLAAVIPQRKALVFSQLASMLDVVESGLFRTPAVGWTRGREYLRLDGSVAPAARHALAQRFNTDPSVRVLVTTTGVGGLGLTLTGADTVIFLDHAWNPAVDLQAMDRAHRLGQTARVSVFRLLARDTFEERVMGLQRWKLGVAGALVGAENGALSSMADVPVLDLLLGQGGEGVGVDGREGGPLSVGLG